MKYTVYTIKYKGNVKYVGITNNLTRRIKEHRNSRGTHHRSAIPKDVDLQEIEFVPISTVEDKKQALTIEDKLIIKYNVLENGWNKYRSGLNSQDCKYIKGQKKEYHETHIENEAERKHQWYIDNKEERLRYSKEYRKTHRNKIKEQKRKYYSTHREEINAIRRERYKQRKNNLYINK